MLKKIPPYSKNLFALQRQGLRPTGTINIWLGNEAWQKGKQGSIYKPLRTLILPPWECPTIYQWPVNQCDIDIIDTGFAQIDYVEDLAYCLYLAGADRVRFTDSDYKLTVYHKE